MTGPSKKELTLDKLRISTQTLILKSKWNDVSVQEISKLANVSIGTFYNYFDSKDAALIDLKKELSNVLFRDLSALLKVEPLPINKLTLFVKYFFELVRSKTVWATYLLGGTTFSDRLEPCLEHLLASILTSGCKEEVFSIEVSPIVIGFIEKGLYGLLQQALDNEHAVNDIACAGAELTLKIVGVPPRVAKEAAIKACPCTPLHSIPTSLLAIKQTYDDYAKHDI